MRYFVNYGSIVGNKDNVKREKLRLQAYNLTINFLNRGKESENYIYERFAYLKNYFESQEFCRTYFLSPFVINQSQLVQDLISFIMSSGETNQFNKIIDEIKREVELIKPSKTFQSIRKIQTSTADEFLEKYYSKESPSEEMYLTDDDEYKLLKQIALDGYRKGDEKLSVLHAQLLYRDVKDRKSLDQVIILAEKLHKKFEKNIDLILLIATCYYNQYYQDKDKGKKSLYWYKLAATKFNESSAIFMVGLIYFLGMGVQKNVDLALSYWEKAAELNDSDAIACIGIYYLSKGDKQKARPYLERSAATGDYKSLLLLDTDFDRV
ncbi:MAG: hypothetical protein WCR63_02170 [Bacilli bacterium]